MTLSRSTPLRSDASHTFPEKGAVRTCEDCNARWDTRYYDDPPPWPCNNLKRTKLDRNKRINPYNADRRARSRTEDGERHTYGPYFIWACDRRCCACGAYPCVPHHLDTVGTGGRDAENLIDCCAACHDQIETEGLSSWEREYGIDASERAMELWERYREEEG